MIAWLLAAQLTWAGVLSDGNAAFEDGRLDEAIALWSEVDRPSGRLLYNLGNAYYRKGDRSRALACYRQAQPLRRQRLASPRATAILGPLLLLLVLAPLTLGLEPLCFLFSECFLIAGRGCDACFPLCIACHGSP